ncbi:hypothetical protein EJD97_002754, partial [Solanum chilense]
MTNNQLHQEETSNASKVKGFLVYSRPESVQVRKTNMFRTTMPYYQKILVAPISHQPRTFNSTMNESPLFPPQIAENPLLYAIPMSIHPNNLNLVWRWHCRAMQPSSHGHHWSQNLDYIVEQKFLGPTNNRGNETSNGKLCQPDVDSECIESPSSIKNPNISPDHSRSLKSPLSVLIIS